jgi:hypothetical protein
MALYTVPSGAKEKLQQVDQEIHDKRSCFRVIKGEHGEGKTAMLRYIQRKTASERSVCYSNIAYTKEWVASESTFNKGFLALLFSGFTFPNGELLENRLINDSAFRNYLKNVLLPSPPNEYDIGLATTWKDYTTALCKATDENPGLRSIAISFLKGQNISSTERGNLGVSKVNVWSTNPTPAMTALKFYTALCRKLGFNGFFLTLDEIEQLGFLGPVTGKTLLTRHRDFVNLQDQVLKTEGFHLFYSISTWYLEEAGLTTSAPKAAGVRISKPSSKTKLSDVDRVDRIIREPIIIPTTLGEPEFLQIIEQMKIHYEIANPGQRVSHIAGNDLLSDAIKRAGGLIPGKVLSEVYTLLKARATRT